jgi:hypothetical protein
MRADWIAQLRGPPRKLPSSCSGSRRSRTRRVDPNTRFNYLEIVRTPAHYICTRLDRNALGSTSGEGHAQLAQSLQNELATGYKVVVRDALLEEDFTSSMRDLVGHACHRALADLSFALRRTYEFYTEPPAHAWYEINQLLALAEELGLTDAAYADEQTRSATQLTITDIYLRLAMLPVNKPNQLRQKDLSARPHAARTLDRARLSAPADDTLFVVIWTMRRRVTASGQSTGHALRGVTPMCSCANSAYR